MTESRLRRPLLTFGITVIAALVVLLSAFTLLARGTFTSSRLTTTLSSGWVALGVRAPDSAGGVVTTLPVGGGALAATTVSSAAVTDALSVNDPNTLSAAVADTTSQPMAGALILDRLALAALVDAVGGFRVSTASSMSPMRGTDAAAYVLDDATGQRLHDVTVSLLQRLPRDHDRLMGIVKSLGMSMRATVSAVTVVRWVEFWQSRL